MSDLGSKLPVPIKDTVETKEILRQWTMARIYERKSQLASLKRQQLLLEQDLANSEEALKNLDAIESTASDNS